MTLFAAIAGSLLGVLVFLDGLRRDRRAQAGHGGDTRLHSLAQIAFLTGGRRRTGETVVAALIEREQVRLDTTGRLHRTPLAPVDELGAEAVEVVGLGASVAEVISGLSATDAMADHAEELTSRGLLVDTAALRRGWWRVAAGRGVLLAAGGLWLGLGSLDWFVVAAVVALAGLGVAALVRSRHAAWRTDAGHRAVRAAWDDRSLVTGAAGAVAVGGLGNHPDREVRIALSRGEPTKSGYAGPHAITLDKPPPFTGTAGSCGSG